MSSKALNCGIITKSNVQEKMHFEISERKMILRLFDVLFVLAAL
jgi:hypothetical protein